MSLEQYYKGLAWWGGALHNKILNFQNSEKESPNSIIYLILVSINKGQSYSFPGHPPWLSGKESICTARDRDTGSIPGNIPWRRAWQPTPAFLPGELYGQRALVGYSPWGHKESDMTKMTEHSPYALFQIGFTEGRKDGEPLQAAPGKWVGGGGHSPGNQCPQASLQVQQNGRIPAGR